MRTLRDFQALLPIRKHRLDEELELQGEVLYRIGERKAAANSVMQRAKDDLASVEAEVYTRARDSVTKITVQELQGIVQRDPKRRAAWLDYVEAREVFERWESLYESWRSRGFALKALGELYISSYYTTESVGSTQRHQQDQEYQANRRAAASARHKPPVKRRSLQD